MMTFFTFLLMIEYGVCGKVLVEFAYYSRTIILIFILVERLWRDLLKELCQGCSTLSNVFG